MPAWESALRITPAVAWGNPGAVNRRGYFLYTDSANLDMGAQVNEREQKLLGLRDSPADVFSIDSYQPKGNFTVQPRVDDVLMLLMSHFQNVVKGNGTYIFYRVPISPDFGELATGTGTYFTGSYYAGTAGTYASRGTSIYSINVDNYYGASAAPGTGANGARYTNGIAEKLTFNQKFGEDLSLEVEMKFLNGSWYSYGSVFQPFTSYGSLSEHKRLVDYHGTALVGGEAFELQAFSAGFSNNSSDRGKIGKRGFQRFPFAGHYLAEGSFDMELTRDLGALIEGGTVAITADFLYNGTGITFSAPNAIYRPFTIPINGGEGIIEVSKPFRAYPLPGTRLAFGSWAYNDYPGMWVKVITGTDYSSTLLGF